MSKIIFIDTETTGLEIAKHAIVQIGAIIEIDGEIKEKINLDIAPFPGAVYTEAALKVTGKSVDELTAYPASTLQYREFKSFLAKYVDKFDKTDKFHFVGYNAVFDDSFLRKFFKRNGDSYYGSYFWWPPIDVAQMAQLTFMDTRATFKSFKLQDVAAKMGLDVKAGQLHDALFDIELTRDVFHNLWIINKKGESNE